MRDEVKSFCCKNVAFIYGTAWFFYQYINHRCLHTIRDTIHLCPLEFTTYYVLWTVKEGCFVVWVCLILRPYSIAITGLKTCCSPPIDVLSFRLCLICFLYLFIVHSNTFNLTSQLYTFDIIVGATHLFPVSFWAPAEPRQVSALWDGMIDSVNCVLELLKQMRAWELWKD